MRVVIVKDDDKVVVDGVARKVDCSALPADFHALQWDGAKGEVEHRVTRCDHCGARSKKGNDLITDLSQYQRYVDAWLHADEKVRASAAGPQT